MEQQQDDSFLIAENEEGPTRMGHSNDVIAAATVYEINIRCISTVEPHGQHFDEVIRAPHSDGTPNPASPHQFKSFITNVDLSITNTVTHSCKHFIVIRIRTVVYIQVVGKSRTQDCKCTSRISDMRFNLLPPKRGKKANAQKLTPF